MTAHLRDDVRAYVERSLPEPVLRGFDRHVTFCVTCRAEADQERRIVASLRADTGLPQSLRSSLLRLADPSSSAGSWAPSDSAGTRAPFDPGVPAASVGFRMPPSLPHEPVPTVPPQAPALHRSPMRAAVVASLAAGASVAAAWSLTVAPLPTGIARQQSALPAAGAASIGAFGAASIGAFGAAPPGLDGRANQLPGMARSPFDQVSRIVHQVDTAVAVAWLMAGSAAASAAAQRPARLGVSSASVVNPARVSTASSTQSGP